MDAFMQALYSLRPGDAMLFYCFWYVVLFLVTIGSILLCRIATWRW